MPIYEFNCQKCGKHFENLILNNDDIKKLNCPSCGGKDIKRLLSIFSSNSSGNNQGLSESLSSSSCSSHGGFS